MAWSRQKYLTPNGVLLHCVNVYIFLRSSVAMPKDISLRQKLLLQAWCLSAPPRTQRSVLKKTAMTRSSIGVSIKQDTTLVIFQADQDVWTEAQWRKCPRSRPPHACRGVCGVHNPCNLRTITDIAAILTTAFILIRHNEWLGSLVWREVAKSISRSPVLKSSLR